MILVHHLETPAAHHVIGTAATARLDVSLRRGHEAAHVCYTMVAVPLEHRRGQIRRNGRRGEKKVSLKAGVGRHGLRDRRRRWRQNRGGRRGRLELEKCRSRWRRCGRGDPGLIRRGRGGGRLG